MQNPICSRKNFSKNFLTVRENLKSRTKNNFRVTNKHTKNKIESFSRIDVT